MKTKYTLIGLLCFLLNACVIYTMPPSSQPAPPPSDDQSQSVSLTPEQKAKMKEAAKGAAKISKAAAKAAWHELKCLKHHNCDQSS